MEQGSFAGFIPGKIDIFESIPLGLRHAMESGECVLFIGAGIGSNVSRPDGKAGPSGGTLARELAENFDIDPGENPDLTKIAQVVELRKGRLELETFLKSRLADLEPDAALRWLFSLRWKAIFTTNYDRAIQRAYELNSKPVQQPRTIALTPELVACDPRFDVPVYHLHGTLFGFSEPSIIITQNDYAKFRERRRMLFEILKKEFATSTVLYIRYSHRDSNWKAIYDEIASEFFPSRLPPSFRVAPDTDPLDIEILKSGGIDTSSLSLDDFSKAGSAVLRNLAEETEKLKKLKAAIPSDLIGACEKTPSAVLRFLASWTYVNQAAFNDPPQHACFFARRSCKLGIDRERTTL
jgi:SIR2-like protein